MIASCISFTVSPKTSSVEFRVVSSAYKIKLNLSLDLMISFIRTLNKKGPITDPWGTPDVMGCVEELTSPTITYCFRLDR